VIVQLKDFLMSDLISFGSYGISLFNIILIIPILLADFLIHRLVNRFLKKRDLLQKGVGRTVWRVFNWAVHFAAFLGVMRVIGVKLHNVFDFIGEVLNFKLFRISGTEISLLTIIVMIAVVWISAKLAKFVRNYFEKSVFPRFKIEEGLRFSLSKIIGYLIITIGVLIALQGLGIKLSTLAIFAGTLGVGIGFGMQNITNNVVSGIVILFERPIKEGDMIRFHQTFGVVHKIRLRASVIRTIYNEHLIVPNAEFINGVVENMTTEDIRLRVSVKVGVAYGTEPGIVRDALVQASRTTEGVMEYPIPLVLFRNFGDSALEFELLAWIADPAQRYTIESDLRFSIVEIFKEANITIAFPQRDIWIRSIPQQIADSTALHDPRSS
jgi:small-conductance mechanosensitive channel